MIPRHASNRNRPARRNEEEDCDSAYIQIRTNLVGPEKVRSIDRRLRAIDAELREIRSRVAIIVRSLSRCVHRKIIFERLRSDLLNEEQVSAYQVSARAVSHRCTARFRSAAAALKRTPGRHRKYNRNAK